MECGHLSPRDEGLPSPARQGSPYTQGCGTRLARALSPTLIGHAYTSHYRDPHSEEGDHLPSTCSPFEEQR
jgi:hypothetical protein